MGKRNYKWNKGKYKRYIKEGRGYGEGSEYNPWLTIHDYTSRGRVSRVKGWKTGRIHHLQSDICLRFFYLMEWDNKVIDIRECFPLLDISDVIKNKEDLRLDLFKDTESNEQYVLTTSFLITLKTDTGTVCVARSVKNSNELNRSITIEKLEVERRYWENRNVDWGVITEKEIPIQKCKNIEWLHIEYDMNYRVSETKELSNLLLKYIKINQKKPLRNIINEFDCRYYLESGSGLLLLKYLITNRIVLINIDEKIDLSKPAEEIIINMEVVKKC